MDTATEDTATEDTGHTWHTGHTGHDASTWMFSDARRAAQGAGAPGGRLGDLDEAAAGGDQLAADVNQLTRPRISPGTLIDRARAYEHGACRHAQNIIPAGGTKRSAQS